MSPAYDVVCTLMWDGAGDALPFPVNWACYPWDVAPADWKAEAAEHGLDGDRVAERAVEVARSAVDHAEEVASGLPPELAGRFVDAIGRSNAKMVEKRKAPDWAVRKPAPVPQRRPSPTTPAEERAHVRQMPGRMPGGVKGPWRSR